MQMHMTIMLPGIDRDHVHNALKHQPKTAIYIYIDLLHLCEHFQTLTRTAAEVIGRRSSMAPIMV